MTSSTSRGAKGKSPGPLVIALRSSLIGGLMLGLAISSFPSAQADSLTDARERVRKALVTAKKDVASDKSDVKAATAALQKSQQRLASAKSELALADKKVAVAKAVDAQLATALARARQALAAAKAAEAKAEKQVVEQRSLIAAAARSAYQQQSNLVGMSMILGSESSTELASRLQWSSTIFDATSAQLDRLTTLEAGLQTARVAKASAESALESKKADSEAQVAKVASLAAAAATKRAEVATLVAQNAKLKAAAEDELEQSQAAYDKLEKSEAAISAKIRAQAAADDKDGSAPVNKHGFIKPVNASAGSAFGMRFHPILHYWRMHWGTDFGASCGTPIRAMANGKVTSAGMTSTGLGKYTIISYGKMYGAHLSSGYAHQSKIVVHRGQKVKQGQIVGYVGTTGLSTGCHLHLQIYRNGTRVNPMRYL